MIPLTIQNIVWIGICLIVLLVNKVSAHVPVDRPSLLIVGGAQNVTTQHTAAAAANNNNNSNNRTTTPATNKSTTFKFSRRKNKYVRVDAKDKKTGLLQRFLSLDKWSTIEDQKFSQVSKIHNGTNTNMIVNTNETSSRSSVLKKNENRNYRQFKKDDVVKSTETDAPKPSPSRQTNDFATVSSPSTTKNFTKHYNTTSYSSSLRNDESNEKLHGEIIHHEKNETDYCHISQPTDGMVNATERSPVQSTPKENVTASLAHTDPIPVSSIRRINAMDLFGPSPPSSGQSSSPFILIPGQPPMRPQPNGPPSSKEATIATVLSLLIPLISRLAVLTILGGTSLFGHGDNYIYSPNPTQHFMFERLNDRYEKDEMAMKAALQHAPGAFNKHIWNMINKRRKKDLKKKLSQMEKENITSLPRVTPYTRTVIVFDVHTVDKDMESIVEELRDAVSFIISQYHDSKSRLEMGTDLEVVIRIESPGGVVHDFGLASDQLARLKEAAEDRGDLKLTICVDKIAASGGYMMACQASEGQLVAAPWAVIGSIGVLRETINVHDLLEKYNVRPLLLKSGNAKVPLTATSKVTKESLQIVEKNLMKVHEAFRSMVKKARGESITQSYDEVTSGDTFLGKEAKTLGLVDQVMTSDEYLYERVKAGDRVLKLHKYDRSRMMMRLSPLDLLLLRTDDIFGKKVSTAIKTTLKIGSELLKVGATFGAIQVLDKNYSVKAFRNHIGTDI
jgi:serine protease SohB